jgi:hypothetical protein
MMLNKKFCFALLIGLLSFAGGQRLGATGVERQPLDEIRAKMATEGWKEIGEGVFERQLGGAKAEHLGYGREGLVWTIGELNRQLDELAREYRKYPSDDLAKVIDHLSARVADAQRELRNMKSFSSLSDALVGPSCSICYSATADAFSLTPSQGVGAVAEAKFNNDCGNSGDTYAFAYARGTLNGTTTTLTQEDLHSGTSVTSHAAATVNGASDCLSAARSYVQSTALAIIYTTSTNNSSCPAPPPPPSPTVAITGPSNVVTGYSCVSATWTATISNLPAPYTYKWFENGVLKSTNSSYTKLVCYGVDNFRLDLTVTGSNGVSASDPDGLAVTVTRR